MYVVVYIVVLVKLIVLHSCTIGVFFRYVRIKKFIYLCLRTQLRNTVMCFSVRGNSERRSKMNTLYWKIRSKTYSH